MRYGFNKFSTLHFSSSQATQWNDFKDAVINRQKAFMNKIPRTPKGLSYYNEWWGRTLREGTTALVSEASRKDRA